MVLSAIVDISARKRMEARMHAIKDHLAHMNRVATAGELSSSIAHESNNRSRRWSAMPTRDCVGLKRICQISRKREQPLKPLQFG